MKSIFTYLLLALSLQGMSQATAVTADPGVGAIFLTDLTGTTTLNANTLVINTAILLHLPIYNTHQTNAIPTNTTKIKIGLGSKMILDPGYNLATAPLSIYYLWSYAIVGGQGQITGDQIASIPADFIGEAVFKVIPNVFNTSTITANNLITNNNPAFNLSDADGGANNTAQLQYTVVSAGPVPVNITKFDVSRKGCSINVNFLTQNEINVDRFEIETSKNGTDFTKVGNIKAANRTRYATSFSLTNDIKANAIFVRIKSIDLDGSFRYSDTKSLSGNCEEGLLFNIYPNPVISHRISLLATSGLFNGKYNVVVMDVAGRIVSTKNIDLINTARFNYDAGILATGKYILKLSGNNTITALPFEKL